MIFPRGRRTNSQRWTLSADDLRLTVDHGEQAKLGLMCQLAFWREHARFPEVEADIAPVIIEHLARQIVVSAEVSKAMPLLAETVVNSSGRLTPKVINTARITDAELQEVVDER